MKSMESKTKMFSLPSHGTGNVQAGSVIERVAAEAWTSGVLHKFLAGTTGVSCFHPKGASAAATMADFKSHHVYGGGTTSLCFGEGLSSCAFEWGSLNGRVSESMVCPALRPMKHSSSGMCAQNKAGPVLGDGACCNMQLSGAPPEKLEVHMSETYQKRFIMFDHSGNKKRIIFHPSMVHEISNLLPSNLSSPREHLDHLQDVSSRAVDQMKETMAVDIAEWEAGLPSYKEDLHADNKAPLGKMHGGLEPFLLVGDGGPLQFNAAAEAETSIGSGNRVSLDWSTGLHEDTDLEALLSSDDEISTGHSPSDGTWNDDSTSSDNDSWCYGEADSSKKRKIEVSDCCNGNDTCSTATSSEVRSKGLKRHHADTSHTGIGSFELVAGYSEKEFAAFDTTFPGELSSKSCATKQGQHCFRASRHGQYCALLPGQPEPFIKTTRREKIKDTFRLLRGIIPGGDCMDAAFVLDETIQYVKSLQVQVKAQKLEGRNAGDVV